MIRLLYRLYHRHKLTRMVERNRKSFECEQFRRRRAAALKATRGLA